LQAHVNGRLTLHCHVFIVLRRGADSLERPPHRVVQRISLARAPMYARKQEARGVAKERAHGMAITLSRPEVSKLTGIELMGHLFRRAGFGATRDQLEAALARGYEPTVEDLLHPEHAPPLEEDLIYRYYPDRAQLFQAVTDREFAQQLDEVRTRANAADGLEAALAIIGEVVASAALRYHTRDHLRHRDRGLAQYLYFQQRDRLAFMRTLVRPYVEQGRQAGELTAEVSLDEAVEWIVTSLAMIPTLPASQTLDFDDPVAVGRFFASRLCRGLSKEGFR